MKLLIGGTKGGTGKSTIATNLCVLLAHQNVDVMLLDTDKQASSAKWHGRRETQTGLPVINCTQKQGDVSSTIISLSKKYPVIIVDAGGYDSDELRSAMVAVDALYIPIQPSQFDLETLQDLAPIIVRSKIYNPKLKVFGVISKAGTNPSVSETAEAKELLMSIEGIQICNTVIRDRKVFREVTRDGRGVYESNNTTAIEEMIALGKEIFNG